MRRTCASLPADRCFVCLKELREAARQQEKCLLELKPCPGQNKAQINSLEKEVDEAWRKADVASQEAGVEYVGSDGVRMFVPQEDTTQVGRALALYKARVEARA